VTGRPLFILLLVLACSLTPSLSIAALKTFVEPRLVDEMDTVRLTIRKEGSNQSEPPDLTPLDQNFEVLGSQTSSRISSINGRTTASVEYQISLRPRGTGELTIPSLTIGGEQSEAIVIRVRPLDPAIMEAIKGMVFFETELSTNPVYVQAETVLTRRLFYSQGVQIYSDLPGTPEIENAVVIPLGETQSRSVLRDGRRYGVIEQRFALFPEQSGTLTIPAISVTSSVRLQSQGLSRRSGIRVSTEEIELPVKPIPTSYPADATWLPASEVSVSQRWTPRLPAVDVGDPLTFQISIRTEGNRGSAIPPMPLPLPADQFKIYPEAPEMDETADSGTVIGTRRERFALIPTRPGPVEVPEFSLTWWDTQADQLRRTQITVPTLRITGQAAPPASPPEETVVTEFEPAPAPAEPLVTHPGPFWPILLTGALAVTFMALLTWLTRRFGYLFSHRLTRLYQRYPVLDRRPALERRRLSRALIAAGQEADLTRYRQALVDYLCDLYGLSPGGALQQFRQQPEARRLLRELEQASYAEGAGQVPSPDLVMLTALARAEAQRLSETGRAPELPALYG
jgi:hypothetical protein